MNQRSASGGRHTRKSAQAQPQAPRPDLDAPTVNLSASRDQQQRPPNGTRVAGIPLRPALIVVAGAVTVGLLGLVLTYALSSLLSSISPPSVTSATPSSTTAAPSYSAEEQDFLAELSRYGVADSYVDTYPREWIAAGKYVCSSVQLHPTYGAVMNWSSLAMNADISFEGQAFYGYRNGSRLVQASLRGLCPPPYSG